MKKLILTVLVTQLLAGCAGSPIGNMINNERQETRADMMQSWVGESEERLVSKWGPPTNSYTLSSGGKIISYEYVRGIINNTIYRCTEKFRIDDGTVTKWGLSSGCDTRINGGDLISKDIPIPQPTL